MFADNLKKFIAGLISTVAILAATGCTIADFTSSTSSTLDAVTPDITLNRFVDVRIASIQKEAATGEGENLIVLAKLMGQSDNQAFSDWMHVHYNELFDNLQEPSELITRINRIYPQAQS